MNIINELNNTVFRQIFSDWRKRKMKLYMQETNDKDTGQKNGKEICCVLSRSVMSNSLWSPWATTHQAPLSMGILQARILEWVAMPSSRGSSQPRDWTQVSHSAGRFFTIWATTIHTINAAYIYIKQKADISERHNNA